MAWKKLNKLTDFLIGSRLLDRDIIDRAVRRLGATNQTGDALLEVLESEHALTPYQVQKLRDQELDALVLGDYKLMYCNASGSFARVFRACSVKTGDMFALKLLRERWSKDTDMVQLFKREAVMVKRLNHRNIVRIFDISQERDRHYFTMEFIEGGTLRDFIAIRKQLDAAEATRLALDVASGLEHAFSFGVTHRDLKMSNVLITAQGVGKLIDFGLGGDDGISGYSAGDGQQRALEYATLEKATGAPANDPRSDLFFLGTIYYELLSGVPPYARTRDREAKKQLSRYQNVEPIRTLLPGVHRPVEQMVEKLLALNPHDRCQTPSEAVAGLRDVLKYLGESDGEPGSKSGDDDSSAAEQDRKPVVLCVEKRPGVQKKLREQLGELGYRVLVLSDPQRAAQRLGQNSPDCFVVMAPAFEHDEIVSGFQALQSGTLNRPIGSVIVLSGKQTAWRDEIESTEKSRVLTQPVNLKTLSEGIAQAIAAATGS